MKTIVTDWIGKVVVGYLLNSGFSSENQRALAAVQKKISEKFSDAVFTTPPETLHITLMDWLAPLVDYGRPKDELFAEIKERYYHELEKLLPKEPINISFNELRVTPGGIIVTGTDNGSYQKIRQSFIKNCPLIPKTKEPPTIIHSTLARFTKEMPLAPFEDFVAKLKVNFTEEIREFRLCRESQVPALEYEIIKSFKLG